MKVLYQERYKINHIAQLIGRHRSPIYRELKRYPENHYLAQDIQEVTNQRARHKGRKPSIQPSYLKIFKINWNAHGHPNILLDEIIRENVPLNPNITGFIKES